MCPRCTELPVTPVKSLLSITARRRPRWTARTDHRVDVAGGTQPVLPEGEAVPVAGQPHADGAAPYVSASTACTRAEMGNPRHAPMLTGETVPAGPSMGPAEAIPTRIRSPVGASRRPARGPPPRRRRTPLRGRPRGPWGAAGGSGSSLGVHDGGSDLRATDVDGQHGLTHARHLSGASRWWR